MVGKSATTSGRGQRDQKVKEKKAVKKESTEVKE